MPDDMAQIQASLQQITAMLQHLTECIEQTQTFTRPVLTLREAADLVRMNPKTLQNVVSQIRVRTGKSPNFILKGGGHTQARFDRDLLLAWLRSSPKRRGRPPKHLSLNWPDQPRM